MRTFKSLLCAGAVILALAVTIGAQTAGFEVASIKPSNPNPTGPLGATPYVLPALGRLTAQNTSLRILVMAAYQKQPFQIVGGPPWFNSDKFDINAKAVDGTLTTDQMLEALKTLLADRFKLKLHTETRDVPIYALVLARSDGKLGAKLKGSADDCPDYKVLQQKQLEALAKGGIGALAAAASKPDEPCSITSVPQTTPGAIGMKLRGQGMELLTLLLTQLTGRPVADKTGLKGLFDIKLVWTPGAEAPPSPFGPNPNGPPPPPVDDSAPTIFTAIQEQLGLRLEGSKGPVDVVVIDSAEKPSEN